MDISDIPCIYCHSSVRAKTLGIIAVLVPAFQRLKEWADEILLIKSSTSIPSSEITDKRHRFQTSAFALAPWQTLVAAWLLLPFAFAVDGTLPPMNVRGVASLAYVGPIATAFAYWSVVEVGRYVRATTMSVALLAVPSLGRLISAVTFHEAVSVSLGLGVALIGAGVLLTTTGAVALPGSDEDRPQAFCVRNVSD